MADAECTRGDDVLLTLGGYLIFYLGQTSVYLHLLGLQCSCCNKCCTSCKECTTRGGDSGVCGCIAATLCPTLLFGLILGTMCITYGSLLALAYAIHACNTSAIVNRVFLHVDARGFAVLHAKSAIDTLVRINNGL
jgi:hypothetical protein